MTDLSALAAVVQEHAAERGTVVVPAVPEPGMGPEVHVPSDLMNVSAFLHLAQRMGAGAIYLEPTKFDPDLDDLDDDVEPPAELLRHRGEVASVSVAFVVNGLTHFWRQKAAWYQQWDDLNDDASSEGRDYVASDDVARGADKRERSRLAAEFTAQLLADEAFRAARGAGARQRHARLVLPGTESTHWAVWEATRAAIDQAEELAQKWYAGLEPRLDDLAAELLTVSEYRAASSAAARKQAAERFLIAQGDGFAPPTHLRDEIHARAQRLAKNRSGTGQLL